MTALILDTSSSSGSGRRPIRFLHRSCRRSARLERETPMTSATVFIGNRPSAATAAAAVVFLTLWPLIGSEYQPIRGRGQPFWVCGRDRRHSRLVRGAAAAGYPLSL